MLITRANIPLNVANAMDLTYLEKLLVDILQRQENRLRELLEREERRDEWEERRDDWEERQLASAERQENLLLKYRIVIFICWEDFHKASQESNSGSWERNITD